MPVLRIIMKWPARNIIIITGVNRCSAKNLPSVAGPTLSAPLTTDISVGDLLLNRIATEGSTLLVMGGTAPGRLGSSSLGEVARHILRHMTVPVLMSH